MDEAARLAVAGSLEELAAVPDWDDEVWKRCYDLVGANSEDELVAWVYEDLIHCSAVEVSFWRRKRTYPMFDGYRQEFRDVAEALRSGLALKEFKDKYCY